MMETNKNKKCSLNLRNQKIYHTLSDIEIAFLSIVFPVIYILKKNPTYPLVAKPTVP